MNNFEFDPNKSIDTGDDTLVAFPSNFDYVKAKNKGKAIEINNNRITAFESPSGENREDFIQDDV